MELNIQKPNQSQNVALAQTQSQKTAQPQEQKATQLALKPTEAKEKKELSPRAKLVKGLNELVAKIKSLDKRETSAKNALENAKKAMARIEEERVEVEKLIAKFELSNSTTA